MNFNTCPLSLSLRLRISFPLGTYIFRYSVLFEFTFKFIHPFKFKFKFKIYLQVPFLTSTIPVFALACNAYLTLHRYLVPAYLLLSLPPFSPSSTRPWLVPRGINTVRLLTSYFASLNLTIFPSLGLLILVPAGPLSYGALPPEASGLPPSAHTWPV